MKKPVFIVVAIMITVASYCQNDDFRTIFQGDEMKISGFGGPMMSFTSIDGEFVHMMGGGGAVLINNFFIGGYGMGKTNKIKSDKLTDDETVNIEFGHGGLWLGYIFMPKKAIHPTVHTQIGWGQISQQLEDLNFINEYESVNVFVLVPAVEMEMNMTRFFKIGMGANMRFVVVNNSAESSFDNKDLMCPGAFLSFKFGWF
jgi:hypothetical protein